MNKSPINQEIWQGIRPAARERLETRDYDKAGLSTRLATCGVGAYEAIAGREELASAWIPGVELFARRVYQQKGRGHFCELTRLTEGTLFEIGFQPKQWAAATMFRDSAKGIHIHPPCVPDGVEPARWFQDLFIEHPDDYARRRYDLEQWDVMFFLTGITEMILVDEREGLPRRIMRFTMVGDSQPGADNAAVVIPPGVGHALRSIGREEVVMVYGTSTTFKPEWEGRIASEVELAPLPAEWECLFDGSDDTGTPGC